MKVSADLYALIKKYQCGFDIVINIMLNSHYVDDISISIVVCLYNSCHSVDINLNNII